MNKEIHYKVWSGGRGKVFATLAEAEAFRNHIIVATGYVVAITETTAKVTHIYEL